MKGFRLNGQAIATSGVPGPVLKLRQFFSTMPDGDLLTTPELVRKTGYTLRTLQSNCYATHPELTDFRQLIHYPLKAVVWGNKKTIARLRKHKEILA